MGQNTTSTAMSQAISQNDGSLISWIYGGTGDQITQTVYDIPYSPLYGQYISQQNLRNRVSYTVLYNQAADTSYLNRNPASASYYTYDIHGNVDTLLQDYNGIASMKNSNNRFKLIAYNYDLISGKVNEVDYQPGRSDAFYEMYSYDAENRITAVNYSRDKQYWEQEAAYEYYKHGPLARTVLGQLQVQGLKYRYTLQGWLKGVNAAIAGVDATAADSSEVFPVSHDAYGFSLHYYPGDYTAIKGSTPYTGLLPALGSSGAPLFNGNIAAMAVNIKAIGSNAAPLVYNYHYDQLNRLVAMDAYSGLNTATGSFTPLQLSTYAERAGCDPNGNITSYIRHGDAARVQMDSLTYSYKAGKNQLDNVVDNAADVASNLYSNYNDLKQGQQPGNYQYDAIGNLISDAQAGINTIIWTVYGKIDSIYKTDGTGIKYHYDVAGNRISKVVTKGGTVNGTYYVRDAQGNVLSVYQDGNSMALTQMENHLYGSSRLGMVTALTVPNQNVALSGGNTGIVSTFTRGENLFELSNHLGNVLVTLTDKKLQHSSDNINVDYYVADVASASDYYPFGMQMPGRNYTATNQYRYGFNGQENSTEIAPNTTTAEYWEYDSRIGRRWNVDPKQKIYESPYLCFSGNPILLSDPNGDVAGDPPKKLYHNTKAGKDVFTKGFNGATHGKYSNYNWFSTKENAAGTGRTGQGVSLGVEGVDVSEAKTISIDQTNAFKTEALKDMGYTEDGFKAARKTMSKGEYSALNNEMNGRMYEKLGKYMDKMKESAYFIEKDGSFAVTDAVANAGTIKSICGSSSVIKALNGLKWAGRTLMVVAAKDVYDIYSSGFAARTIVTKAGGWAGAWAAGTATGTGLTATGIDLTGPWGWAAHGVISFGAGVGGYFAGEYVSGKVYDYVTKPGAKPGMQ